MKTKIAVIATALSLLASGITQASTLYFYGKVTSATGAALFQVNDPAEFIITYNPANFLVTDAVVNVRKSSLNLIRGGGTGVHVTIDSNPADGTVQWAVGINDASTFFVDVATNTPGGVIPCIDNFDLGRTFQIFLDNTYVASGTITSVPWTGN